MAHPVRTTVPAGALVGGLVGVAFAPWWVWAPVGVAAGGAYATVLTLLGLRVMRWLRRGSPERRAGVTVGGWIGAIVAGLAGAIAATVRFVPPNATESAELFATGALGLFAAAPPGFVLGGLLGGLLTALYDWLDTRFVTPLRAKSVVVDRATMIGAAVGFVVAGVLVLVFGLNRRNAPRPPAPDWLAPTLLVCLVLGLFWAIRLSAKQNRESGLAEVAWLANPRRRWLVLAYAVGFAGGAVGFLVGVVLHLVGWRVAPAEQPARAEKPKARPGWWRKRPRR